MEAVCIVHHHGTLLVLFLPSGPSVHHSQVKKPVRNGESPLSSLKLEIVHSKELPSMQATYGIHDGMWAPSALEM